VAALFVVTYAMATPLAAYGVFLPILTDTFGWSRGAVSSALSLNLLVGGLSGLILGPLADRREPRGMLTLTVSLAGAGFALVATVSALWHLYLFVGLIGGVGMSSFYLLSASTITRWFEARRGVALAAVLVGFNIGYITAGPLAAWLVAEVGWRTAYALIGSGSGLAAIIASATVRLPKRSDLPASPPPSAGAAASSAESGLIFADALADPRQWYMNGAWLLLGALSLMVSVHAVPFARDQGVGLAGASLALTAYGIGAVGGRLSAGALSDRFGTAATMRAAYLVETLSLAALLWVPSKGALLGALLLFGAGFAASDTMLVRAVPDVFGTRAVGAVIGVLSLGWRCGAALGPAAAGFLHDVTGSYALPFAAGPVAAMASWILFTLATSRPQRAVLHE
jgi:MFS family permease